MKIYIFSKNNFIKYNNIKIVKIFTNKNSFSIMKNHFPIIGNLNFIIFFYNNKIKKIILKTSFFIQKKKELKIICENYYLN